MSRPRNEAKEIVETWKSWRLRMKDFEAVSSQCRQSAWAWIAVSLVVGKHVQKNSHRYQCYCSYR